MSEFINIFKEFDIENVGMLIMVCVMLICMAKRESWAWRSTKQPV